MVPMALQGTHILKMSEEYNKGFISHLAVTYVQQTPRSANLQSLVLSEPSHRHFNSQLIYSGCP